MGYNSAWSASGQSGDLDEPEVVDGGFNGWWIEPTNGPEAINIIWTAQRLVTIGLAASLAAVLACAGVLLAAHRRRPRVAVAAEAQCAAETPGQIGADSTVASILKLGLVASSVALLVGPLWGAVVFGVGAGQLAMHRRGRPVRIMAMSGIGVAAYVAIAVAVIERRKAPFPNAGWTNSFEHLNGLALTAVALVAASTMFNPMRN